MSLWRCSAAVSLAAFLFSPALADFPIQRTGTEEENARDQKVHPAGSARVCEEEPQRDHNPGAHHTRVRRKATATAGDPEESGAKFEAATRSRSDTKPGEVSRNGKVQTSCALEVASTGNAAARAASRSSSTATFEHLPSLTIDAINGTAKFGIKIKSTANIRPGAKIKVKAGNSWVEAEYLGSNLQLWHVRGVLQRSTAADPDAERKRFDEILDGRLNLAFRASEASTVGDTWTLNAGQRNITLRAVTECGEQKHKKAGVSASVGVKIDA